MSTEDVTGSAEVTQPVDTGSTDALGGSTSPGTQVNDNPAWTPYLEKFPEPVRGIARDTFSEWDKGVQERFGKIHEQYKPYKAFADQGVKPEDLQSAWGLADILQKDPQGFAQMLAQHLGMTIQEAAAATDQLQQDTSTEEVDPRIQKLQEGQQQLMDYISQRDEAAKQDQLARQQEVQLTAEMDALEETHGKLDDFIKNKVLEEALRLSTATNKPVTMEQAYSSLEAFVRQVRSAPRPGDSAPRVMSSGGTQPITPPVSLGDYTGAQTRALVAQVAARHLASTN